MSDQQPRDPAEPLDPVTARRIADAFAALATAEVPASAPRPQHAPRPAAGGDRRSRRRRFQIAGGSLLAVAAAVVVALVVGAEVDEARTGPSVPPGTHGATSVAPTTPAPGTPTTPAAPTTPPSSPGTATRTTPAPPSFQQVTAAFVAATGATRSAVVVVPGGFEGADLDNAGTIRFWRWSGSAWVLDATSTYPADAPGSGPSHSATLTAASLLSGMDHATYLVDGPFTGDSTGSVPAYTDGAQGWGVIKAGADGLLHPSGDGFPALGDTDAANIGLSRGEALVNGELQTTDCSTTSPDNASCGLPQYSVVKSWRWDGSQFVLDHRTGPAS